MVTGTARGYTAVLRTPGLPAVYAAHLVSMLGTVAAQVALSVLVYERTRSALLSALVLVASFVPYALGGTVLSALADRYPARPVLVAGDLLSGAAIAAMLVPGLPVGGLLGLLVVTGLVASVYQGARAASLAALVPAELFPAARSVLRTLSQTAVLVGFATGSVVVASVGARWMLGADAASFVASAALIGWCCPPTPAPGSSGRPVLAASLDGVRVLARHRMLRRLLLLGWAGPAFGACADGLATAYCARVGAGAAAAGVLFTAYSAGMLLGETGLARCDAATRRRLLVPLAVLTPASLLAFANTPPLWVAAGVLVLTGTGLAVSQSVDPLLLAECPPERRGSLFTVQSSGLMTVQGLGIAAAGALGEVAGPGPVMAGFGALGLVAVGLLLPAVRTQAGAQEVTGRWRRRPAHRPTEPPATAPSAPHPTVGR